MNGAFHISGIGLEAQQGALDKLANNIANVNTNGFKRAQIEFSELVSMSSNSAPYTSRVSDTGLAGVMLMTNLALGAQGELERTDESLDIAITGAGFIEVLGDNGQSYLWRGGRLEVNQEGFLAANNGMMLSSSINVPDDARDIRIAANGRVEVLTEDDGVLEIGQIDILRMRSDSGLEKLDGGFYRMTDMSVVENAEAGLNGMGEFVQGSLERSNVDLNREMIDMMIIQRAYSANAQVVQAADQLASIANNLRR